MKEIIQFAIHIEQFAARCRAVGIDPEPLIVAATKNSLETAIPFWDVLDALHRNELLNQHTHEAEDLGMWDDMGCYFDRASLFSTEHDGHTIDVGPVTVHDNGEAAIARERTACEAEERERLARRYDERGERWDVV